MMANNEFSGCSSEDEAESILSEGSRSKLSRKSNKAQLRKVKKDLDKYRTLLIEENNLLMKEQFILQKRLQQYFDLESEINRFIANSGININAELPKDNAVEFNQKNYQIVDFTINLSKKSA